MRLKLNKTLRAALIAAASVVGFTITSAQAVTISATETWIVPRSGSEVSGTALSLTGISCNVAQKSGDVATNNVFAPDTNVGTGNTWTLTFSIKNTTDHAVTLDSLLLDVSMYNSGGSAQSSSTIRTVDFALQGGGVDDHVDTLLQGKGNVATPVTIANSTEKPVLSFGEGGVTLASNGSQQFTLTVARGSDQTTEYRNGCFYGLIDMVANFTYEATASVWKGTQAQHNWSESASWSSPVSEGAIVEFDGTADYKTATVDVASTAGSITVSGAAHTFELAGGDLTTDKLTVGDGGSLTLTGAGTVAATAIDASGKTITINEGVVLTGAGSGTLDGEGRYVLADGSAAIGGMQLADTWAGVVAINGAAFADNGTRLNTLNGLSKADSWVALKGTSGWSGGTEISANLLLEKGADDWAFKQNNGNNNTTLSFTGKIKGDGKLGRVDGTGSTYTYAFSGDISGWTGTFQSYSNDNQSTTFRVSGAATSVKANLVNARGTFKVDVQNSATFDGSVDATALTVAGNQTATFNGTTAIGNGVTLGSGAKLVNGGTLTLGGTVTFGGKAIENNGGTVHFGNNLVFNLDGLTPSEEEAGVHTYTLFSGSTAVNLTTLGVANITLTDGTSGKVWSFSDHGTVSWTLPSELEWDNTTGNNKWSYSDANWHGSVFVENAAANFYQDATVEVSGNVVASAIAVGNGEAAANVTISAGEASSLTATTLQVDNGSLTTNVTIQGLGSNTVAAGSTWHIAADQTIAAGAIDGSVDVAQGKTVTLVQAATAKDLLLGITGQGNIALGTNVSFNSSDDAAAASTKATGTLTLKEGVKLTVGNNKDKTASIASFGHVVMEQGAGIETQSRLVEINNLTVNTDASHTDVIKMLDTYSKDEIGLNLKGTTTLNGNLEINSGWKYKLNIETLAGTGKLTLKGGSTEQHTASIGGGTVGGLELSSSLNLTVAGATALGDVSLGDSAVLNINQGVAATASSLSIRDNNKATLRINGSLDVSGNFYAIGCSNTTDIIGSGDGSSLTVGSLNICNFGTNFNLQNITMTVKGLANAGDSHNSNTTHIDLNAGSALNLLGAVTFKTSDSKYCTLNVNGGALTAGADEEGVVTRVFQNIAAGTSGGTVDFLNGSNTVANLDMTAGNLAVTVGEHASLTLAAGTLMSAIANEGVLTINGAIGLDNIGEEWVTTNPYGYEGSDDTENNGFVASALTKVTFATGDGSVVLGEGVEAAMTYKGYHGTVTEGVFNVLQDAPDHSTYHLNSATEESLATAISVGGTDLNLVIMNAGTNLSATGVDATVDTLRINTTGGDAATLTAGTASFTHLIGEGEVDVAAETTLTAANITVAQGKELTIGGEGALHGVTAINGAGTTHVDAAGVAGGALAISGGGTTTFGADETISLEGLNISGEGTTVTFNSLVTVTGDARPSVGYENPSASGATVTFNAGFEYNGTNGYGLLLGNGNTVYLGGTTDLSDKNVGISATGKIVLNEGADVKFGRVINTSSNNNNNGIVEVADGAVLATVANAANYITTLTNAGEVTFGGSATIVTLNNSGELAFGKSASVANLDNSGALTASGNITVTDSYANTGSITVVGSKLSVNNSAESLALGSIVLDNGELNINYGGEGRVRDIGSLAIAGNSKLTQTSWNNFMHIGAINDVDVSQPGSFTWEMKTDHWSNSVLYLTGAGNFSGTFTAKRTAHSGNNGAYQGYVQIDDAKALQNAVLNVVGYQNNADVDYMSVALHTATVETAGLSGNAQAIVYAGVADNTTGSGDNKRGQIAPSSVGTSTLVLDVAEDADLTYSGAVLEGISLQKDGAGAQTFNGDMSRFNGSVTVNDGTLTLGGDNTYTYSGPTVVNGGKLVVEGVLANSEITVGQNATVENKGSGALTLAGVDVQLTRIENISGNEMSMKNAEGVLSLKELTIGAASTVSFYDKADTPAEGTITVTETLTAGGGTLLANLTVKGGSTLDMVSLNNELATLTLGSELSFAEDGLVSLSDEVITLLNGMEVDGYWDIFQTYEGRNLDFVGDYDGAWFGSLFNRNGKLVNVEGDFQIEATPEYFRLVKNSMVPEPTTGTLSLLALAGLCARRRRK